MFFKLFTLKSSGDGFAFPTRRFRESSGWEMGKRIHVAYLFTTFPVLTETFLRREIRVLKTHRMQLDLYSLWGGKEAFEEMAISRFSKWRLITLIWKLPYWVCQRPGVFGEFLKDLARRPSPSLKNSGETLLGFCFAIIYAGYFDTRRPDIIHATWATMPATAALLLKGLTGIPFSMGAHAYDVFEDGGDWLLRRKLREASFVRTSSEATLNHLKGLDAGIGEIVLIRRGLNAIPEKKEARHPRRSLRLLSVGRLVEKMGYFDQLALYAFLKERAFKFEARIVGEGKLRNLLWKKISELDLKDEVSLMGELPFAGVKEQLQWADVFIFTGKVASSGDRAGLPNAIPEAMSVGVPVLATPVSGVREAVRDGKSGFVIDRERPENWFKRLQRLQRDDGLYESIAKDAHGWVETHFNASENAGTLFLNFQKALSGDGFATVRKSAKFPD